MHVTTMWILSYSLAVLLALGACDDDIATVYAYSPGSSGGHPGPNNPSLSIQEVKWGFKPGSYRSQADSSGTLMTSEKPGSGSTTSQQGFHVDSAASGSLVYGSVGNAVNMGMSVFDSSLSTNVQGSEVISSALTPLQQSSYSVSKPVQVVSSIPLQIGSKSVTKPSSQQLVQTISQSSSEQPTSSGTMSQSSPLLLSQPSVQQISQTSFQSAVPSGRWPLKPLQGKPHQTGSRPAHTATISSSKPSIASQPSSSILQYGSVPSSLAVNSYGLVSESASQQSSQSSGQIVSQPSLLQPLHVTDISAVQPSSQLIQQVVDASVAQASRQQLLQGSQSVSQSNNLQPVDGSYVVVAQPSGLTPLKHHKGKHHFGSKPFSNSPLHTLRVTSRGQTSSQKPVEINYHSEPQPVQMPVQANYQSSSPSKWQTLVQASYQSEAQPTSQQQGQTSYQTWPRFVVQQPAQIDYQSASQPTVPQLVQVIYDSEVQSASQQPGQTNYQLVAKPSDPHPGMVSFSATPLALHQPAQASYQLVAELGVQQPAQVSSSVAHPSHLHAAPSSHEYVVKQNGQTLFKPVQSHGIHQVGSKLYSCHELPQHGYQRRHISPSTPSFPTVSQDVKPVVLISDPIPVDPYIPNPLTSTVRLAHLPVHPSLQSVVVQSEQPVALEIQPSDLSLVKPGPVSYRFVSQPTGHPSYQPTGKLWQEVIWPFVKPNKLEYSSFEAQVLPSQISSIPVQLVSQPQTLLSSLSLAQPSSSSAVPVQSDYQPPVVSKYETILQPVLQTSSVVVPSSSQAWSSPIVSNYESVLQSVQPELPIPAQLNYQLVTNHNSPGPAGSSRHSSRKLLKLLQQVKS